MTKSLESPSARNSIKDNTSQSQFYQHRIEHATTITIVNDRYTTTCTLQIRPIKDETVTSTQTIHSRIFDAIKEIEDSTVIISLDQKHIHHDKDMPKEEDNTKVFKNWRMCNATKRKYVSIKLESTQTLSQLKYGS